MAGMVAGPRAPADSKAGAGGNGWLLPFMLALFFAWGLATVLVDIVTPKLKSLFALSYTEATLTQFCFFAAYALISLPAGAMVTRIGSMRGLVVGLVVMAAGCLLFAPAARIGLFPMFLLALFVMASGIAVLQVAANPLVAGLGDPAQASSRLTLAQTFNALGTTVGPVIGAWAILSHTVTPSGTDAAALAAARQAEADVVRTPFLVIAAGLLALAVLFWFLRRRVREEDAGESAGSGGLGLDLLRRPRLAFGALAIFLYVGAEVAIGTLMVSYLEQPRVLGASPETAGHLLSFYWGGALAGRIVGSFVLRAVRPGAALCAVALAAGAHGPVGDQFGHARGLGADRGRPGQRDPVPDDLRTGDRGARRAHGTGRRHRLRGDRRRRDRAGADRGARRRLRPRHRPGRPRALLSLHRGLRPGPCPRRPRPSERCRSGVERG